MTKNPHSSHGLRPSLYYILICTKAIPPFTSHCCRVFTAQPEPVAPTAPFMPLSSSHLSSRVFDPDTCPFTCHPLDRSAYFFACHLLNCSAYLFACHLLDLSACLFACHLLNLSACVFAPHPLDRSACLFALSTSLSSWNAIPPLAHCLPLALSGFLNPSCGTPQRP